MNRLWFLRWELTRRVAMAWHVLRGYPLAYRLLAAPTLHIGGRNAWVIECEVRDNA